MNSQNINKRNSLEEFWNKGKTLDYTCDLFVVPLTCVCEETTLKQIINQMKTKNI